VAMPPAGGYPSYPSAGGMAYAVPMAQPANGSMYGAQVPYAQPAYPSGNGAGRR
jgi:hypothetical protein